MSILVLALLIAFAADDVFPTDGERDGRRGNALYEEGSYAEAAEAYSSGLAVLSENDAQRLSYGLHNNLGAALLKSGDAEAALGAFKNALRNAVADADLARTAYNAGNAAFSAEDLESAAEYYRQSLLRSPDNEDAKYNYEFVKRRLQEQQQQQQEQQQQQGGSGEQDEQEQNQQSQGQQGQDEQQQQQGQDQQQEGGQQQDQQPQNGDQNPQEQQHSGASEGQLSEQQAQRILQALQNEEEQLLREVQRPSSRPRQVEKDW